MKRRCFFKAMRFKGINGDPRCIYVCVYAFDVCCCSCSATSSGIYERVCRRRIPQCIPRVFTPGIGSQPHTINASWNFSSNLRKNFSFESSCRIFFYHARGRNFTIFFSLWINHLFSSKLSIVNFNFPLINHSIGGKSTLPHQT